MDDNSKKIYSQYHLNFFDKIIIKRRYEMIKIINDTFGEENLTDVLDIGTTSDEENSSSNFLIKNLKGFKTYKSLSDQKITSTFFDKVLQKSITDNFNNDELNEFSSDLIISNATIEHVGNYENQYKMIKNIINLCKKNFIIITPNRFHPIEFHTKLPFIHWLPKKIHRHILKTIGFKELSKEANLNLLTKNEIVLILKKFNNVSFQIKNINFLLFNSNIVVIGKKIN